MNVTDQFRDVMHRTMSNLQIFDRMTNELPRESQKPFEVTQLVNSVMGAVAWPREQQLSKSLKRIAIGDAVDKWGLPEVLDEYPDCPQIKNRESYKPNDMDKLLSLLRNGFAHGNFQFVSGADGEIESVHIWNLGTRDPVKGEKTWGTTLNITQLRQLLEAFVRLADYLYDDQERARKERARTAVPN